MPMETLSLKQTAISDLSLLRVMPFKIIINECQVTDLSPLTGGQIHELIIGPRVQNLAPLRGMPLKDCLEINSGNLDLSPLSATPLVSFFVGTSGIIDLAALLTSLITLNLWEMKLSQTADLKRFTFYAP